MIAKRLGAVLLAIALIAGAWVVRDRVIDGDDGGDDGVADPAERPDRDDPVTELVCATELEAACKAAAGGALTVRVEPAGDTLDALVRADAEPIAWVTFDPLPAIVDRLRAASGLEPFGYTASELASSPIAVVVLADRAAALASVCPGTTPETVDLACVGEQSNFNPTLSPLDMASGILGAAAVVDALQGSIDVNDTELLLWARRFIDSASPAMSAGRSAVQTIQTRSTFDVAIGFEAELAAAQRSKFAVLYADPMVRGDVMLMVPGDGTDGDLPGDLTDELLAGGWVAPMPTAPSGLPDDGAIAAIRAFWDNL